MLVLGLLTSCFGLVHPEPVLGLRLRAEDQAVVVVEGAVIRHRAEDAQAAEIWRAEELRRRHPPRWNLPMPTLCGRQWWSDRFLADGWRIQEHALTGHCRLVDAKGLRRAWGTFAACRSHWESLRVRGEAQHLRGELVLLVHGLGRSQMMWGTLPDTLRARGHQVQALAWASTRGDLDEQADHLCAVLADLPEVTSIRVVTHSLGGLLLRQALARSETDMPDLRGAVMCFPPNRGADLADLFAQRPLLRLFMGPSLDRLTHAQASSIAAWGDRPLRIIAGTAGHNPLVDGANDWVVSVDDTRLAGVEPLVFPVSHTFGVADTRVIAAIIEHLEQ